jgi:hypothetical protein
MVAARDVPAGANDRPGLARAMAAAFALPPRTAILSDLGKRWGRLGLGHRIGGLWQRSMVRPWRQTVGRLGISRLWQPGPGVREAADPGARTLALITVMPVLLLVAWLVPGLLLLLAHKFLPAPMVLISVPVAVALTILIARELPGRWPAPGRAGTKDVHATAMPAARATAAPAASPTGTPARTATAAEATSAADALSASAAGASAPSAAEAPATDMPATDAPATSTTGTTGAGATADSAVGAAEAPAASAAGAGARGATGAPAAGATADPAVGAASAPAGGAAAAPAAGATPVPVVTPTGALVASPTEARAARATDAPVAGATPVPAAGVTGTPARSAHRWGVNNRRRAWPAWWGLTATMAIAAAFAAWQWVENSPQFIVNRDPGAYVQVAYWIANHGQLPIPSSAAAFGGSHPGLTFGSFGFAGHNGDVVPGLTVGLPIILALGVWAHGVTGAAALSPLIGALAILAVGGLTARLAGPQWAPAGALVLALTVPEVYTSRSAFSVTLAQALLFGGMCLVVDSFFARWRITLASLGGLALGLTVLAGMGFVLMLLPVIVVAGALLAGRRPQGIPLAAGWLAGVICGLAGGIALDDPALSTTTPSFGMIGALAGGLVVLTALGATIALVGRARQRAAELLAARPLRWLPEAGAALVALAGLGLAFRPYLQHVHGPASPYIAALQRLEGLPVDPGRLYAENSLYWVIWYLGLPALLLGLIGLAMVTRVCLRALITWKDPSGTAQSWVLPAAVIGWGLFAVLWQPATVPDQPWASRQLVPVVLPGLIVLAVWVAAWLIGRAHARGAGPAAVGLATACFVVAMGVPPAAITFGIALSQPVNPATQLALSGLAFRTTGAGELTAVEQLCGAIPQGSSVVLLDQAAAREFAEVIRGTCGVPTGIVTAPGNVPAVIGGIERAGRHPALLATRAAELTRFGAQPRQIVNLATQQDEHLLTKPPTSTWPVGYTLWMSQPGRTVLGS